MNSKFETLRTGFLVTSSSEGKGAITIHFPDIATMHKAHDELIALESSVDAAPETDGRIKELQAENARLTALLKQPMSEQNARFAIDEAIGRGKEGTHKPPTEDHWLMPYWNIGQQLANHLPMALEVSGCRAMLDVAPSLFAVDSEGHCD